jgi:glycosyltransferase involved in cell wall biosynthesis
MNSCIGRQKRILCVTDVSMASVIGGAERVLFEQNIRLARRGYEVHVLTRQQKANGTQRQVIQGVTEWRYPFRSYRNDAITFWRNCRDSRRLFDNLQRRYQFDWLHMHQPISAFCLSGSSLYRSLLRLYTCHSLSFEEYASRNKRTGLLGKMFYAFNLQFRKWIERSVTTEAHGIVGLSRFTLEKLAGVYGLPWDRLELIEGGIDLDKFTPAQEKNQIRASLGIPRDRIVLLTVRNLVPRMGLENLLRAYRKVLDSGASAFLVIGGDGPLKGELLSESRRLDLERDVAFVGFIPEEHLADHYRMADLFILPTCELEGFGLVTLEALASGVPVLGTPVGGTKEILGRFDASFLFNDITPESMAALILEKYRRIKEHPVKWAEICARCRRFVEENYSWERNVDALENVLFSLSSQNRKAKVHGSCRS